MPSTTLFPPVLNPPLHTPTACEQLHSDHSSHLLMMRASTNRSSSSHSPLMSSLLPQLLPRPLPPHLLPLLLATSSIHLHHDPPPPFMTSHHQFKMSSHLVSPPSTTRHHARSRPRLSTTSHFMTTLNSS